MPFDGTTTSPVLATLLDGRRKIEQGWIQNAAASSKGVCLAGSIAPALTTGIYAEATHLLKQAICDLGYPDTNVMNFNDARYRTKEQVLAVCDTAIALAAARAA